MRNLVWKILFIVAILAFCVWEIIPPSQKIRLGKDLRGGVSLIYHVRVDPRDPDPQRTLSQVISVLKERVNPQGVLDITMQPMGRDRIEVVMPIPNPKVQALRVAYEDALQELLREAHIPAGELQSALEAGRAVQRFGGEGERGKRIKATQEGYDALQAAWEALEQAREAGATPEALRPLEDAVAGAEIDFEAARDDVLRLSLGGSRVERALRLSINRTPRKDSTGKAIIDRQTGKTLLAPSPRAIELSSLGQEFPHLAESLDAVAGAYDAYAEKRSGFDDPEDLMRLLRGAGVLEYRIAVRASKPEGVNPDDMREQLAERGPENTDSPVGRWFLINDLQQWYDGPEQLAALQGDPVNYFARPGLDLVAGERDGKYYLLLYITDNKSLTHERGGTKWTVESTFATTDNLGRPAVGFRLDSPGGREMNRLTGPHVGEPMAIILDGQVYSAPTLRSQIGNQGVISGTFSEAELSYLVRVLAAGSLEARMTPDPIAISTLGPSIGADNLSRGLGAFKVAIIAVAGFMILYYFFAGMVMKVLTPVASAVPAAAESVTSPSILLVVMEFGLPSRLSIARGANRRANATCAGPMPSPMCRVYSDNPLTLRI